MNIENIIEYIKPYIKAIKIMKKHDWMLIYNDKLICINNESSIMYIMDIIPTDIVICNTIEKILEKNEYMDYSMYYKILDKYINISDSINNIDLRCEMNNLELDDNFSNLLKLKSKEPMHRYIIDNIYIPIFYGYLPVNKGDTLNIKGGIMKDNTILINYTIYKKKLKKNMDIYLRLLPVL